MILADVNELLNDVIFEVLRAIGLLAVMVLGSFLGITIRKAVDKKKAAKEAAKEAAENKDNEEE